MFKRGITGGIVSTDGMVAYPETAPEYVRWVQAGNAVQDADPLPDGSPSRDARLLAAVDSAKTQVAASKAFTVEQAAVLAAVFDGLGKAITGEAP